MFSFNIRQKVSLEDIKDIVSEANKTGIHLPSLPAIRDLLRKANDWLEKGETFRKSSYNYPFLDELESHVNKGETLPVILDQLVNYKKQIEACKNWKRKAFKTFLKKNTLINLTEVSSVISVYFVVVDVLE